MHAPARCSENGRYNRPLMLVKIRRALALSLLLISISLVVWAALPNPRQSVTQSISPSEMQLPSNGQGSFPYMMASRQVVLEQPISMRIGETELISLVFEPVLTQPSSSSQLMEITYIYDRYNIMAEARYEVAGITLFPANPTRELMPAGQTVKFKWHISTHDSGSYKGTIWLSLRFLPLDGSQAIQIPIYIRDMTIQTTSLFGMNEAIAYFAGGTGIVLAGVLVLGDVIRLMRLWMRKKISKSTKDLKIIF